MNIFEMHIGVNLGVQKIASHVNADLLDEEVDYYLNNSINQFIKDQYSLIKNTDRGIPNQYVHENLRQLLHIVILENPTNSNTTIPFSYKFALPEKIDAAEGVLAVEGYKYYISSYIDYTVAAVETRKNNVLVQPQVLQKYIVTESNKPIFRQIPVYIQGKDIYAIGEKETELANSDLTLTYIGQPVQVKLARDGDNKYDSGNSIQPTFLPDHTHKEIVDMTIREILKDLTQFKGQE